MQSIIHMQDSSVLPVTSYPCHYNHIEGMIDKSTSGENLWDLIHVICVCSNNTGEKTMNIFTEHTRQQNVTYMEHLWFAVGIALRLANSVIAFTLHGIFPFIDIKKELDLEATAGFINAKNNWIENKKQVRHFKPVKRPVSLRLYIRNAQSEN